MENIWEPPPSRSPPSLDVTVFTQLSLTRLDQLEQQCLSWSGGAPLSAAVYLPILLLPKELSRGRNLSSIYPPSTLGKAGAGISGSEWGVPDSESLPQRSSTTGSSSLPSGYTQSGATLGLPVRLQREVADAVSLVESFVSRLTSREDSKSSTKKQACSLTLSLFWELFDDADAAAFYYPINMLRNYAAMMVTCTGQKICLKDSRPRDF